MKERIIYRPKATQANGIFVAILLAGTVLYLTYIAASIMTNKFSREWDITAFSVVFVFAGLFLYMLVLLIKGLGHKGPILIFNESGITLLWQDKSLTWDQIRLAEVVGRDVYIYLKATRPGEIPPTFILDGGTYGNPEELLGYVMEGLSGRRSTI